MNTVQDSAAAQVRARMVEDLRALARGLILSVVAKLKYEGLLDVTIAARGDSTDLYAAEARRVLAYVDSVWNAFYGLVAQIENCGAAELKAVQEYAGMMPFPPPDEFFVSGLHPGLFDGALARG